MKIVRITTIVATGLLLAACGQQQSEPVAEEQPSCTPDPVSDVQTVEITAGLASRTLTRGCGDELAAAGHTVVVHYTGWLMDSSAENNRGNKFDSSVDRDDPFKFPLGGGRVIKGWDQGVVGMTVGEVRELTIAPEMAYGDRDIGVIPPGSTLVFEVELIALQGGEQE
jgi:FKBP-type peptidyl-prolyl cis-trans isomerase